MAIDTTVQVYYNAVTETRKGKKNVSSIQGSNIESVPAVSTINLIVVLKIFIV